MQSTNSLPGAQPAHRRASRSLTVAALTVLASAGIAASPVAPRARTTASGPRATASRVMPRSLTRAASRRARADRLLVTDAKALKQCVSRHPARCASERRAVQQAGSRLALASQALAKAARLNPRAPRRSAGRLEAGARLAGARKGRTLQPRSGEREVQDGAAGPPAQRLGTDPEMGASRLGNHLCRRNQSTRAADLLRARQRPLRDAAARAGRDRRLPDSHRAQRVELVGHRLDLLPAPRRSGRRLSDRTDPPGRNGRHTGRPRAHGLRPDPEMEPGWRRE